MTTPRLPVGAANVSAAGLTAVKCVGVAEGTGHFSGSLCETPEVTKGNFETVGVAAGTTTNITGEQVGESKFTATVLFVNTEVRCTQAHTTGKLTNRETTAGAMEAEGTETVIHYTECEAGLKEKAAKGEDACQVESVSGTPGNKGTIQTDALMSLTGSEHNVSVTAVQPAGIDGRSDGQTQRGGEHNQALAHHLRPATNGN